MPSADYQRSALPGAAFVRIKKINFEVGFCLEELKVFEKMVVLDVPLI